jgi:hypothetical protein
MESAWPAWRLLTDLFETFGFRKTYVGSSSSTTTSSLAAVPGSAKEARARLGDYFSEVLLLDQSSDAAKARAELDWRPTHPGLVEEFRQGSYRN